jgi:accessory gene regulator B
LEKRVTRAVAVRLANRINRYACKEGIELEKMQLGVEVVLINLFKIIVVYVLAAIVGVLWMTVVAHTAFIVIKRYSFGLHALNSTVCTITSCTMFVLIPWLTRGTGIGNLTVAIVFAGIILSLYFFAPADTKAKPIFGAENRKRLKIKAVVCGVIILTAALLIPNETVKLMLTLGAAYQSISILPLMYKILKRSERNYEKFESRAGIVSEGSC